jgi:hypothetical protein
MANPNIVNVTTIYGDTVTANLTTTSVVSVVSNAASSGKIYKINTLYATNVNTTNSANITVSYYSAASLGGTATEIVSTVTVPAQAALVVIDKNSQIYLKEDKSIGASASVANYIKITCSYEDIS